MEDRFKGFDRLDREILLRALRAAPKVGLRSVDDRADIMMEELHPKEFYSVILKGFPEGNKINVIKQLRNVIPGLLLQDAKKLSESLPATVRKNVLLEEADQIAAIVRSVGATVEIA